MSNEKGKKKRGPYGKRNYDAELEHIDTINERRSLAKRASYTESSEQECLMQSTTLSDTDKVNFDLNEAIQTSLRQNEDPEDSDIDLFNVIDDENDQIEDPVEHVEPEITSGVDNVDSVPLYPGAQVTLGAFMLLLAIFTTKYNLVGDATQQLLNIIAFALPNNNKLCTTLHEFKKFFRTLKNPLVYHYYCSFCHGPVEDSTLKACPMEFCRKLFDVKTANYFLEIPLKNQIKNLYMQDGFYESLQHRFHRDNMPGIYKDIYDGKVYKSYLGENGLLSDPHNISFTFNTDGASVFKSSNVSVWPIFMVINELPYKLRMKKENMILASLWFGNHKPSMGTFLKPLQRELKEMFEGIECCSPGNGSFISRGILLCGTADLPARSLLCNHIQYNGAFSCWKCEQEGCTAAVGGGHARVFPFISENPTGPTRDVENVLSNARTAIQNQNAGRGDKSVKGIKGPSWLLFFPSFNIISGVAIDYMHGVLLGVQKMLIELWFLPKYSSKAFSFHHKQDLLDSRLAQIRPTLDISRLPRSLQDLKYWKASEFRSFLLFYGAPTLHDILDKSRFSHYLLLVNSIYLLLKFGSTDSEIDRAENMLITFCRLFEELYDRCFLRLNVHQLMHLPESVRMLGPLYTHSCFSFEDKNGVLLKMIRGTQNIDNQIVTGVSFVQKLPELKEKCIEKGSSCEELYNSIESTFLLKRTLKFKEGIFILGGIKEMTLSDNEHHALSVYIGNVPLDSKIKCFERLELHDNLIYGNRYARMTKRDNSVVHYEKNNCENFGRVHRFLLYNNNDENEILVILEKLDCVNFRPDTHIVRVRDTREIEILNINSIKSGCMFVSYQASQQYVLRIPNKLESD